jgi:hypothetical protein
VGIIYVMLFSNGMGGIWEETNSIVTYKGLLPVAYKTGFGLDDWIYCTLYIHNLRLQVIQR